MESASNPPAGGPPAAGKTLSHALLAAVVGAIVSTLTVLVGFFVLNPTVITQSADFDDFTFKLVFLGGFHMLFCGAPGCLVGALAAAVPGLIIAGSARSRGALLVVLAASFVIGIIAGVIAQWGMIQLYNILLPCGPAGQLFTC